MANYALLGRGEPILQQLQARFGPATAAERGADLLVVMPDTVLAQRTRLQCRTVLLPGGEGHLLEHIRAQNAVSYGLSGRDTLTLSSRGEGRVWLAVQRALERPDGSVLEQQEIPVRVRPGDDELQTLVLAGAMLLLGAGTQEL